MCAVQKHVKQHVMVKDCVELRLLHNGSVGTQRINASNVFNVVAVAWRSNYFHFQWSKMVVEIISRCWFDRIVLH